MTTIVRRMAERRLRPERQMLRIGIAGLFGRMGRLVAEEARAAGCIVAGGTIRPGTTATADETTVFRDLAALAGEADVVIDFTRAALAREHAACVSAAGCGWVLGTSGLSTTDEAAVADAARHVGVVYAANFAPGAAVVLAAARQLAAALPAASYDAEVMELHHRQKRDAPSGTAIALGREVQAARGERIDGGERTRTGGAPRETGGIGYASLRGGQVVGEHTLLFAGASEHVSLTHRAFDRRAFATGAVAAARYLHGRSPGLYTMTDVLGLA